MSSYTLGGGANTTTGSSISSDITISGVTWNVDDYEYDPDDNTLTVTLTGGQSSKSLFHTFRIQDSNGTDLVVLESSNATFANSAWTWSVSSDPITTTGSYTFVFQQSGGGVSVFQWQKISTGLSVENYGTKKYLNVGTAAASNNDVLFVRKV